MSITTPPMRCSLAIPSHVRLLPVVRLFVGSVARKWGATESDVTDLRWGASELAGAAMRNEPAEVQIHVGYLDGDVVVSVSPLDRAALEAGDVPASDVVGGWFGAVEIVSGTVTIRTGAET